MAAGSDDFETAVAKVNALTADPGNDVKLRLYALYKQATVGDAEGTRPGFTNPVGRAKYDAWQAVSGMPPEEARQAYVDLAGQLTAD
jgi:acyl-CoA-binding protein